MTEDDIDGRDRRDILERHGKYWVLQMQGYAARRFRNKREAIQTFRMHRRLLSREEREQGTLRRPLTAKQIRHYRNPRLKIVDAPTPKGYYLARAGFMVKRDPKYERTKLVEHGRATRFQREE